MSPSAVSALFDVGAVMVTASLLVLSGLGVIGLPRTILALVFVTFVPGWAVLGHLNLANPVSRAALAVAISFTACSTGALGMVWLGLWRPRFLLDVIGAASLAAILAHLARERRAHGTC